MNIENLYPSDDQLISVAEAEAIVWNAGNALLARQSTPEFRDVIADELGTLFAKLGTIREAAEVIAPALGEGDDAAVTYSSITDHLSYEIEKICDEQKVELGDDFNPFMINDNRYTALNSLHFQLDAAKNTLLDE